MSEKSDWEQGYDQARRRFYGERKALTARIAKLEEALNIDTDLTIAGLRKELRDATARIAELEKDVEYWRNRHGKLLEFVAGKEG